MVSEPYSTKPSGLKAGGLLGVEVAVLMSVNSEAACSLVIIDDSEALRTV